MMGLDPRLVEIMQAAGAHYRAMSEGDYWGAVDAGLVISERDGTFEINSWERGAFDGLRLRGATLSVVETFLTMWYGDSWRMQQNWDVLRIAGSAKDLPPGFEVSQGPHGSGILTIHSVSPVRVDNLLHTRIAIELARALSVSLGDLIASYRDPNGLPAFPQGRSQDV